jgi:hypothetical protein
MVKRRQSNRMVLPANAFRFQMGQVSEALSRKERDMKSTMPSSPTAKIEPIDESRLPETLGIRIDAWIARQPEPRPSRAEAVRRLLDEALAKPAETRRPTISDEAALPEIPESDAEAYDGSPI